MTHSWIFTVQYSLLLVKMPPLHGMYDKLDMAYEWSGKNDFWMQRMAPSHFSFFGVAFLMQRVWQKYLTILQNSCEWNCWHGEFVLERPSSETQSISVATELLVCRESIGLLLWRRISKTTILPRLRGYFVGTSIFIGTSVPSRNTSSSEDISRARCTKRNQGQRWI